MAGVESSAGSAVVPSGGGAPQSLEAILLNARAVANKRASVTKQQPTVAATTPASASSAAAAPAEPEHNVGEKGSLKTRASLVASSPVTPRADDSDPLVRPPAGSAGQKRQPKSDDRKRSRTEMAIDNAVASDPNLSDDLSLHIIELKFFYQMSLVQVAASFIITVLSVYIAATGNVRAVGMVVTGFLAGLSALFARTAGTSILGRELSGGQKAMLNKLQLNTYELLFAYMYSSVILAVLSLSFAVGELSLGDNLIGVAGLFLFAILFIGTMLAVRALSLAVVLNYSFQFLNLLFLLFGYAIIFLAGWAYKKNFLQHYTNNSNAWFAASIVIGVSTVFISFWGIIASRRRARKWLLWYAIVLSVLLAGVFAAAVGVYTNDSLVDDAVNQNCPNILSEMADVSVQAELNCPKYAAVGDSSIKADICPVGYATNVWETTTADGVTPDTDSLRFGCLNRECCAAIKEYIHSNGRYLYLMALLGIIFGIAAVVAALYQRRLLQHGIKNDSMPNQEFYIMVAMAVLTVVCIVATPVAISSVTAPQTVPPNTDTNAALITATEVTLSGCGPVPGIQYNWNQNTCPSPCYISATISADNADVQFPAAWTTGNTKLTSIVLTPLGAIQTTQRLKLTGTAADINLMFQAPTYGLNFCPFCLGSSEFNYTTNALTVEFASAAPGNGATSQVWQDTVTVTTNSYQYIKGVVTNGTALNEPPLAGVNVTYEMYGYSCQSHSVLTDASGAYTLRVPIPSIQGTGLAATVKFQYSLNSAAETFTDERILVTIGGPGSNNDAVAPEVTMYRAPSEKITDFSACNNNGGCDPKTQCRMVRDGERMCTHCPSGYGGSGESGCVDINECATNNGGCASAGFNATICTNTVGGYTCSDCYLANHGYTGNGKTGCFDINECATSNAGCGDHRICVNTAGGFICQGCEFGYANAAVLNPTDPGNCTNVNECQLNNGGCFTGVLCTDESPAASNSFTQRYCGPCPPGFSGDGIKCLAPNRCSVNNGNCTLIAAFTLDSNNFAPGNVIGLMCQEFTPTNTAPCGECPAGYTSNGPYDCVDVDECALHTDNCAQQITPLPCRNVIGGFLCQTGTAIINPCQRSHGGCDTRTRCTNVASTNAVCGPCPSTGSAPPNKLNPTINTLGNFIRPFQVGNGDFGRSPGVFGKCFQVNECNHPNACSEGATCQDLTPASSFNAPTFPEGDFGTYGGWRCTCGSDSETPGENNNAYGIGGLKCEKKAVCANCDPLVQCNAQEEGNPCGPCPAGYIGTGYRPTSSFGPAPGGIANTGCQPIHQCATNNGGCHALQQCTEPTQGVVQCGQCPAGYNTVGNDCQDINECQTNPLSCSPQSICSNNLGGFTCSACAAGYSGNGYGSNGCNNINECAINNAGCDRNTTCVDTPGSYTCSGCPKGYTGSAAAGCSIYNECATNNGGCDPRSHCMMSAGPPAFVVCGPCAFGFAGSPYVALGGCNVTDLCATNNGGCPNGEPCHMNWYADPPSVSCPCPPGTRGQTTDPGGCININECNDPQIPFPCSTNVTGVSVASTCTDSYGSYTCGGCPACFDGLGTAASPCTYKQQYCATHSPCTFSDTCVYNPYAPMCAECSCHTDVSFGDGYNCTDVDECQTNHGGCDPTVSCYNKRFDPIPECGPCTGDREGNGRLSEGGCHFINHCPERPCAHDDNYSYSNCTFTNPGYTCTPCPPGYEGTGYTMCTETVPCDHITCPSGSQCVNVYNRPFSITAFCQCSSCYEQTSPFTCREKDMCTEAAFPMCDPRVSCSPSGPCGVHCGDCSEFHPGFKSGPGVQNSTSGPGCNLLNINECATDNGGCDSVTTCTDLVPTTAGSPGFECGLCPAGFLPGRGYPPTGCVTDPALCPGDCDVVRGWCNLEQPTRGHYNCSCKDGYVESNNARTCTPYPYCDDDVCDSIVNCNVNPANPLANPCDPCPSGYEGNSWLTVSPAGCVNINECTTNNGGCFGCVQCVDTPGSYRCEYNGVPDKCPPGYEGDGRTCTVINECATNNGGCAVDEHGVPMRPCMMSPPDLTHCTEPHVWCGECPSPGFRSNGTFLCQDIDECTDPEFAPNGGCDDVSLCQNTYGSRTCLPCPQGYGGVPDRRDSLGCSANQINECLNLDSLTRPCSPFSNCTDLSPTYAAPARFQCSRCFDGYESLNSDGTGRGAQSCVDINECATLNGGCSELPPVVCHNLPGSYYCDPCPSGYTESITFVPESGNFQTCSDCDECNANPAPGCQYMPCDPKTQCVNVFPPVKRECTECPCGFTSTAGNTGAAPCTNVNECALGYSPCLGWPFCHPSAVANCQDRTPTVNSAGQLTSPPFVCGVCGPGFKPMTGYPDDGIHCVDINECTEGLNANMNSPACDIYSDPPVVCENNEGGYACHQCPMHYRACPNNPNQQHGCQPENACATVADGCGAPALGGCAAGAQCTPLTAGQRNCTCPDGTTGTGFGLSACVNINECVGQPCASNANCIDFQPTFGNLTKYICQCQSGYLGDPYVAGCNAVDPCIAQGCVAPAQCVRDGPTIAHCECPMPNVGSPWYTMNPDMKSCTDINECASNNGGCSTTSVPIVKCTNYAPTQANNWLPFECGPCPPGWDPLHTGGDGINCPNENECELNNGGCPTGAICTDTPGNRTCTCRVGFRTRLDGTCENIDECVEGTDAQHTVACMPGTSVNGVQKSICADVVPTLANGWLRFTCTPCPFPGYTGDGYGPNGCVDVNECLDGNGGCSTVPLVTCHNNDGNRTCDACPEGQGYVGTGWGNCHIKQWCGILNNCGCDVRTSGSQSGVCGTPTYGPAACIQCTNCPTPGYLPGTGAPPGCVDYNECTSNNGGCGIAPCTNLIGNYSCGECPNGYTGTAPNCLDINECTAGNGGCSDICNNYPGGFSCTCFSGYQLKPNLRDCEDINECVTVANNGGCGQKSICTNTIGSRTCTCWDGYQDLSGTGTNCVDINECLYNNGGCAITPIRANCTNVAPAFHPGGVKNRCTCPQGYTGSGNATAGANACILSAVNECATTNGGCFKPQGAQASCPPGICEDKPNGRVCKCPPGMTGDGITCTDINECANSNLNNCDRRCGPPVACTNTCGGYYCGNCPPGYRGPPNDCEDINECATDNGGCFYLSTCQNTGGSRNCLGCPTGYTGTGIGYTTGCTNVNECATNNGGCSPNARCTDYVPTPQNQWKRFECSACNSGYGPGPATTVVPQSCPPINECATGNGGCFPGVTCTDQTPGFKCGNCPPGYNGNGITCTDINECAVQNGGCSTSCRPIISCTNLPGSFQCGNSCPPGYTGGPNNPRLPEGCQNINECAINNGGCGPYKACEDTDGSHKCLDCLPGFRPSGAQCVDIDECATADKGGCFNAVANVPSTQKTKCWNKPGTFFCAYQAPNAANCNDWCLSLESGNTCPNGKCPTCPPGFYGTGFGSSNGCADINECLRANACPVNSVCVNTVGSYSCGCAPGFELRGSTCVDIDECKTNNGNCDPATTCTNTPGSRTCGMCPRGFVQPQNGATPCVDINECVPTNPCWGGMSNVVVTTPDNHVYPAFSIPPVVCTNTRGSYACGACPAGFTGDGKTCTDVNECACNNGLCRGWCKNIPGSFVCGPCPNPYRPWRLLPFLPWYWYQDYRTCNLINECATANGGCDTLTQCYETSSTILGIIIPYWCGACPRGYTGSGFTGCRDVNECASNNGGCFQSGSIKSTCTNTPGSRSCGACPEGWEGDGYSCVRRPAAAKLTVYLIDASTGRGIANALIRLRSNTLTGRPSAQDFYDGEAYININGAVGRTYFDSDDFPRGTPAYTATTNSAGTAVFNGIASGGWSIESNGALQPREICFFGCSPFDWCHSRCLWCDNRPTGYSHGFKFIKTNGVDASQFVLALSRTDLYFGQVRIVLTWDTRNDLTMHLTYSTSRGQCDVSSVLAGSACQCNDIRREQRATVSGLCGVETYVIAVPRTTVYQISVQNMGPLSTPIYKTGASVTLYIGWGWWGSSWPYVMLPVAGSDPRTGDTTANTFWAVYCAREYSWSGFGVINTYSQQLDWTYSSRGRNNCPIQWPR